MDKGFQIISRFFPFEYITPKPQEVAQYVRKVGAATNRGKSNHRSNRAKRGLYHGKDVRFGCSISHSVAHTNRDWHPNVQSKKLWSECLNDWVRFNVTTRALKVIDNVGGIDNYILSLDDMQIKDANYIQNKRELIASTKFYDGSLHPLIAKRFGFHIVPPVKPEEILETHKLIKEAHSMRFRGKPEPGKKKAWY